MEINIPKDLSVNINEHLNGILNSKYKYKLNTEILRQNVLKDIEKISLQYIDTYRLNYDENYMKIISDEIKNHKLRYYTSLIYQSGLDNKTQDKMIYELKIKLDGKSEDM